MKKRLNIFKLTALMFSFVFLSACFEDEVGKVKVTFIPNDLIITEGTTQSITLLASVEDGSGVTNNYIEKIEVLSIDNLSDEEYIGNANIILNSESDGVSSKSFDIIAEKSGMVGFDIKLLVTQHFDDEVIETHENVTLEVNVLKQEDMGQGNVETMPNSESEIIDEEVQNIVPSIPVSGEVSVPNFPNLGLPEYMNLAPYQTFAFSLNQDLFGHTISYIKYGGTVANAYKGIDEKSNLSDIRITASENIGGGYIDIYLKYPNYFYNSSSIFPTQNPNGPYYRAENGYLVIRYDVNVKEQDNQSREYYVENGLNSQPPKDYYNPMIKN